MAEEIGRLLEHLKKDIEREEKWLIREIGLLEDLCKELENFLLIRKNVSAEEEKIDEALLRRDEIRVGRAERREAQYEEKVKKDVYGIFEQAKTNPGLYTELAAGQIAQLEQQREVYANKLILEASLKKGKIREAVEEGNWEEAKRHAEEALNAAKLLLAVIERTKEVEEKKAEEEKAYLKEAKIYGRIVTKGEARMLKRTKRLEAAEPGEMVPAFWAENVLGGIDDLSRDDKKILHKLMGGSGAGDRIVLFKPCAPPEVSGIPFRRTDAIRSILKGAITESKFKSGTKIELI